VEVELETVPVDRSAARVRRMFGEIAPRYDLLNHLLSLNVDRYWRWRTVRRVRPRGSFPILDVCSGTGDLALAYGRKSGSGTKIVVADFCHAMLVRGRRKAARAAMDERLAFIEADATRLPLPDDHFQIVSVAFGLRNVSNPDRGLAEMVRVCRPGGRVAVLEFSKPTWQPFRAVYEWYFRRVLPWIGQRMAQNQQRAYNYLPASVEQFSSGEALAERMRRAGLGDVAYQRLSLGIATLYVGTK